MFLNSNLTLCWIKRVHPTLAMSNQGTRKPRAKDGYVAIDDDEDKDIRSSISSNSPILPPFESREDNEGPSVQPSTFQVDGLETFYKPIQGYEGLHRYDPDYTWTSTDERAVVRKVCQPSNNCL